MATAEFFGGEYIESFTWVLLLAILWVEVEVAVEVEVLVEGWDR